MLEVNESVAGPQGGLQFLSRHQLTWLFHKKLQDLERLAGEAQP
jgi:hypothetical protein